jgi:hypothetical protein
MASRFSDVPPSKRLVAGSIPAGGAKATVHSYVRAINTFLAWAKDSGETVGAKAQRPKLERRILAVLTRPEIEAMGGRCRAGARQVDRADPRRLRDPAGRAAEADA